MSSRTGSLAPSRLALAWYFHLPSIATSIEVRDHAYRSLALLMRIHQERQAHVLIAPTSSFLALCRRDAPEVMADLIELYRDGLAEPATTYFHEVDPFSIRWSHLGEQVRRDSAYKEDLIKRRPTWFFAPNFAWHPAMDRLLVRLGVRGVILDSRHMSAATTARAWRWSTDALGSVSASDTPALIAPWESRRLRTVSVGAQGCLRLAFRDWPLTRTLTFGNDAEIHKHDRNIRAQLSGCEFQDLIVLADDGDRIGPRSRRGYEELLDLVENTTDWSALAEEDSQLPRLRELPAFTQPGFDELLRTSLDARVYWSLLDEIATLPLDSAQLTRLLALQEIFYPFWRGCGRRRWYLDAAVELLEELHQ